MSETHAHEMITISRAEMKAEVAKAVRAYMEEEHVCDLSVFSPEELEGIIRQFDDDEMKWGKRGMLYILGQYGPEGKLRGRQDLQEMATRLLRVIDKQELDWQRHLSKHERSILSRGDAIELTRRGALSFITGGVGAAFLYHGAIGEVAARNDVRTSMPAPRETEAWRRLVQDLKTHAEDSVDPKSEAVIGGVLLADAWKEWNRVKRELIVEKLEHLGDAVQELYERTQQSEHAIPARR